MGRFYKTSTPQFIDNKMFELPYELMGKVIQAKDKAVDEEITSAVNLFDKLKADVYESDLPRAKEIIAQKEQAVNDIVEGIKKNPMDYNKYSSQIRNLGRDINSTWNNGGEVDSMQKNNTAILTKIKEIQALHKDDPEYATAEINALKQSYLKGLEYDAITGKGNGKPDLRQTYGLDFKVDDFIKNKLAPDQDWEVEKDTRGGNGYIYRSKKSGEALTPEKIAQAMQSYLKAHPEISSAVGRRSELGLEAFQGANLDTAIGYDDKGKITGVSNDWYGKNIRAAIDNMSYSSSKKSDTIHTDQPWLTKAGWGREDKEKAVLEQVGWTYSGVSTVSANSGTQFVTAISDTNKALMGNYNQVLTASGISADSDLGKKILAGNSHAIEAALGQADPASAQNLKSQYDNLRTQKNLLNSQYQGFESWAKSKNKKIKTGEGWSKDATTQAAYNEYLTANNSLDKKNATHNLVTFDKVGVDPKTIKELQGFMAQNFDDISFNVDETQKGSYLTFEKDNGDKVIYVPQGAKEAGKVISVGKTKDTPAHKVIYKTAPGGKLSVGSLVQEGLIKTVENGEDEDGNIKTKHVTRYNGKDVGVVFDEKTIGLVQSLDDEGKSNFGATMQIGNYRLPVIMPTSQIDIPSVNSYVQENYEDLQFNNFMNKTNLKTLGTTTVKHPGGMVTKTVGDKAYVIDSKGVTHEIINAEEKRKIFKTNYTN